MNEGGGNDDACTELPKDGEENILWRHERPRENRRENTYDGQ